MEIQSLFIHPHVILNQYVVKKKKTEIFGNWTRGEKKLNVTLDHKTSQKSHGYMCSNSQQYIVWVKIIDFSFMPKITRILSKDHVPWRYFVNFLP